MDKSLVMCIIVSVLIFVAALIIAEKRNKRLMEILGES